MECRLTLINGIFGIVSISLKNPTRNILMEFDLLVNLLIHYNGVW